MASKSRKKIGSASWAFYGRAQERLEIGRILKSPTFFLCSISGRRRIGKTTLIREALKADVGRGKSLYVQIPDSDERGVVQAFRDAVEDYELVDLACRGKKNRISNLSELRDFRAMAGVISNLCAGGVIVVLDEFQYFNRKKLYDFTSLLQSEVDELRSRTRKAGGIFLLGSIHTEMIAILEDRSSPLFNRVTHRLELDHWDFATLFQMFDAHGITDARHRLFLWSLFEGVPKFYNDAFTEGVLRPGISREETLRRLFFEGTSPLRDEASNWFLRELRGRYDSVLKLLARVQPCSYGQLMSEYSGSGASDEQQLSSYLKVLTDRYRMVEARQPIFAHGTARKSRYYITDNFLSAWLSSISRNVDLARFQSVDVAVARANTSLEVYEGIAFEKMIRALTEQTSRRNGELDLLLAHAVKGYWNKPDGTDVELDLVAVDEEAGVLRFGSCKRSSLKHDKTSLEKFRLHADRFLCTREGARYASDYEVQMALYSPSFSDKERKRLENLGFICRDISDYERYLL
jgi:AAA+ ATPase superfamily predicted ATPase